MTANTCIRCGWPTHYRVVLTPGGTTQFVCLRYPLCEPQEGDGVVFEAPTDSKDSVASATRKDAEPSPLPSCDSAELERLRPLVLDEDNDGDIACGAWARALLRMVDELRADYYRLWDETADDQQTRFEEAEELRAELAEAMKQNDQLHDVAAMFEAAESRVRELEAARAADKRLLDVLAQRKP